MIRNYKKRIEKVMIEKVPRKKGDKLKPWVYLDSLKDKGVYEFAYRVPVGLSVLDLERQIDALYAACGAVVELKDYAGVVVIRVLPEDFPQMIEYKEEFLQVTSGKDILIGFDRQGGAITHSLRVPHLMIAGKSGYGKTDLIRFLLLQLINHNTSEEIEIQIIDLKGFSFMPFKNIPHITRIARDLASAWDVLDKAVKLMERRSNEVWNSEDRKKTANYKTLFVLIDEAYMISPNVLKDPERKKLARMCEEAAAKISGTGREAGVGLIYCTQRPDAEVINPLVKANMDAKICFKTGTESNSLIVLDHPGAAKLPHGTPGRVLLSATDLIECQVPYVGNDDEWNKVMEEYKHEEREDLGLNETYSDSIGGTDSHILQEEWISGKEGIGSAEGIGSGKDDRRETAGDRKKQSLETVCDWTKIFRDR